MEVERQQEKIKKLQQLILKLDKEKLEIALAMLHRLENEVIN
jgi:hypothetical protein